MIFGLFSKKEDKNISIEQTEVCNYIIGIGHEKTFIDEDALEALSEKDWEEKNFEKLPELKGIICNNLIKSDELTLKQMTKIVDFLKDFYLSTCSIIENFAADEQDLLFIPFKCKEGSTFIYKSDFDELKSRDIAEKLLNMGATLELTFTEKYVIFVHANFNYLQCFQHKGKYDYVKLSELFESPSGLAVTGNFCATFETESGDTIEINEIIWQIYENGSLDEGWESDKTESGNFMAEKEVDEDSSGDEAIKSFYSYSHQILPDDLPPRHEDLNEENIEIIKTWLDSDYVVNNLLGN